MAIKSRILFVLDHVGYGGSERVTFTLMRELIQEGYECDLFIVRSGDFSVWKDAIPKGISIHICNCRGSSILNFPGTLYRLIRQSVDYDVIVGASDLNPVYLAWMASRITRRKCIGWMHTNLKYTLSHAKFRQRFLSRMIYPRLDAGVAVSHGVLHFWQQYLGRNPGKKVQMIRNMVDLEEGQNHATDSLPKESLPKESLPKEAAIFSKPVVIAVGRLSYQKGYDRLLRAHAQLIRKGVVHHLLILGVGEKEIELKTLARQLECEESVFWGGHVSNPQRYMKRSQVFVLSSRYEGFALVLVEALNCGLPVISYRCPDGPEEVLDNGRYGVLVDQDTPEALAEAVERVLADPDVSDSYITLVQKRAAFYAPSQVFPLWQNLFDQLDGKHLNQDEKSVNENCTYS